MPAKRRPWKTSAKMTAAENVGKNDGRGKRRPNGGQIGG
jgi:hypothetical protein